MYLRIELSLYKNKVIITGYIIRFVHDGQGRNMTPPSNLLTIGGSRHDMIRTCSEPKCLLKKTMKILSKPLKIIKQYLEMLCLLWSSQNLDGNGIRRKQSLQDSRKGSIYSNDTLKNIGHQYLLVYLLLQLTLPLIKQHNCSDGNYICVYKTR